MAMVYMMSVDVEMDVRNAIAILDDNFSQYGCGERMWSKGDVATQQQHNINGQVHLRYDRKWTM
jgi:hypothetical protein